MPITRLRNGKLLYYAHVPKCAGTAVERYLQQRFGVLGMHDGAFARRSVAEAWSFSPPQHMPEAVRREILPDPLFDAIFATVRHPAHRLRSVFLFQRDVEKALAPTMRFERWLEGVPRTLALDPYALHGHLRPMHEMVPDAAKVFRVEDGVDAIVAWLDHLSGAEDEPRSIAPANVLAVRLGESGSKPPAFTPEICAKIANIYPLDYARFGYETLPEVEGGS